MAVVVRLGISWRGMVSQDVVWSGGRGADRRGTFCCGVTQVWRVQLRRSRLGSFRKDLIWRSWVRSGGLGEVRRGLVWSGLISYGGLGEVRRGQLWYVPFWSVAARL
jgi:hypothetical protein